MRPLKGPDGRWRWNCLVCGYPLVDETFEKATARKEQHLDVHVWERDQHYETG